MLSVCGKVVRAQQVAHFVLPTVSSPLGITLKFRKYRACWGGELVGAAIPDGSTGLFLLILCQMNTFGFLIRNKRYQYLLLHLLLPSKPSQHMLLLCKGSSDRTFSSRFNHTHAPPSRTSALPRKRASSKWLAIV